MMDAGLRGRCNEASIEGKRQKSAIFAGSMIDY
jgi:hypothetical protein